MVVEASPANILPRPVSWNLAPVFVQPHTLSFLNLCDLRIMHDDLHHAVTQRANLPTDNFQPARQLANFGDRFDLVFAHLNKNQFQPSPN